MKEVKTYSGSVLVGSYFYEKLHEDITKQTEFKQIRNLIDKFTEDHSRPFMCGIDIIEGFVYIITNKITSKRYIGQTKNLIHRMSDYIEKSKKTSAHNCNVELMNDIILYGLSSFSIEFIKEPKHIELESELIKNSTTELYNIKYNSENRPKGVSKKKYIFNNTEFKSKKEITDYIRKLLDKMTLNTYIEKNGDIYKFIIDLIQYNPSYKKQFDLYDVNVKIVKDNFDGNYGTGKYKVFCLEWKEEGRDMKWIFSTNKCIQYI